MIFARKIQSRVLSQINTATEGESMMHRVALHWMRLTGVNSQSSVLMLEWDSFRANKGRFHLTIRGYY